MRRVVAVLLPLLLAACGGARGRGGLEADIVPTPPSGYERGPTALNGAYSLQQVAEASPTPAPAARQRLVAAGFRRAEGRLFRRGSAYAVAIVVETAGPAEAERLARDDTEATARLFGTATWTPEVVPDAVGYLFNGQVRGAVAFCQGAWLWHGPLAAHLYTCDSIPATVATLEELMRAEHELLVGGALPAP